MYLCDSGKYPPFAVTVDLVVFTLTDILQVLLLRRTSSPFDGQWALPGGFVRPEEDIGDAAVRELLEKTGLDSPVGHLEQLGTYGAPDRDPRMRIVSVAHWAFVPSRSLPVVDASVAQAQFWPVSEALDLDLGFDHHKILTDGLERARAKLEYSTLATALCPDEFTIPQLVNVYRQVWGTDVHVNNMRRKVLATTGFVTPLGRKATSSSPGPSAALYQAGGAKLLHPPILRTEHSK